MARIVTYIPRIASEVYNQPFGLIFPNLNAGADTFAQQLAHYGYTSSQIRFMGMLWKSWCIAMASSLIPDVGIDGIAEGLKMKFRYLNALYENPENIKSVVESAASKVSEISAKTKGWAIYMAALFKSTRPTETEMAKMPVEEPKKEEEKPGLLDKMTTALNTTMQTLQAYIYKPLPTVGGTKLPGQAQEPPSFTEGTPTTELYDKLQNAINWGRYSNNAKVNSAQASEPYPKNFNPVELKYAAGEPYNQAGKYFIKDGNSGWWYRVQFGIEVNSGWLGTDHIWTFLVKFSEGPRAENSIKWVAVDESGTSRGGVNPPPQTNPQPTPQPTDPQRSHFEPPDTNKPPENYENRLKPHKPDNPPQSTPYHPPDELAVISEPPRTVVAPGGQQLQVMI